MTASISINIEANTDLSVSDMWPDGDAPANPTASDVVQLLLDGGLRSNLRDWSLLDHLDILVSVDDGNGTRTHMRIAT